MGRLSSLYFRLITIQIRSQLQYRVSFWMEMLSTGLLNGSYFLSLVLILERFNNIMGWTLGEVAFLAGMIEMSFATMDMIFSGFDPDSFSTFIRTGLIRPDAASPGQHHAADFRFKIPAAPHGPNFGRSGHFHLRVERGSGTLDVGQTALFSGSGRQPGDRVWRFIHDGFHSHLLDDPTG